MDAWGQARWTGGLKDGKGEIDTKSGVLSKNPYGFNTRFEDKPGTNPEELIGAAHASCFSMALSKELGDRGVDNPKIDTKCDITLSQTDDGFSITRSHLTLSLTIGEGDDQDAAKEAVNAAKTGCPVSKLLDTDITLDHDIKTG